MTLRDHQTSALADLYVRWQMRVGEIVDIYLHPPALDDQEAVYQWNIRRLNAEASLGALWDMPCRSGKTRTALSVLYYWISFLQDWGVPPELQWQWAYPHLVLVPTDLVRDGPWPGDWASVVPAWNPKEKVWRGQDNFSGGLWPIPTLQPHLMRHTLSRLQPGDVAVMTYHTLSAREEIVTSQKWQVVVADEVHRLKDPTANWTQAAYKLQSVGRLGMSATPFTNYVHELREVLAFLQGRTVTTGGKLRRISPIWPSSVTWKRGWCKYELVPPQRGHKWRKVPAGARYPDYMYHKLRAEVMFSATTEEVSDAPAPIIRPLPIPLSTRQAEVYEQLRNGVLRWMNAQGNLESFDTGPIIAQFSYLFQLCADARQLEMSIACHEAGNTISYADLYPGFSRFWPISEMNSKLQAIFWVLDEVARNGEQVLILTAFARLANLLSRDLSNMGYRAEALTGDTKDKQGVVNRFASGESRVVICTRAAWEGISLQAPFAMLLGFVDHTPGIVHQALLRAWNMFSATEVEVYDVFAPGTVEEWNRKRLKAKERHSMVLTNGRQEPLFDVASALQGVYDGKQ